MRVWAACTCWLLACGLGWANLPRESAGDFGYEYSQAPFTFHVSRITLPNSAWVTNHFDSLSRLDYTALVNRWGHVVDGYGYGHDLLGLRTNITRDLGLTNSSVAACYDSIGQLTSWRARKGVSGPLRLNEQLAFVYDQAGNLRYRTNGGLVQTFNCDALNQLTNVTRNNTMTVSGATPAPASSVTVNGQPAQTYGDFTFARTNTMLSDGNNAFSITAQSIAGTNVAYNLTLTLPASVTLLYDSNGNLTNDGIRSFAYDAENQLTNITVAGQWKVDFVLDGLGRRRIQRDFARQGGDWVQTNETRHVYDGWQAVQERGSNNAVRVSYTRGLDLSGSLAGAGGIGSLLARTDTNGSAFYHADGAGNATGLMDGSQSMAARYMYSAFGNLIGKSGAMADMNVMGFSSTPQVRGIPLYLRRPYIPELQRWGSADPIGEAGGINLYGFVRNNPVGYIDPDGGQVVEAAVAPTVTASSGGAGTTITVLAGGATVAGGSLAFPLAAGAIALPGAGVMLFGLANTPPSPVLYPSVYGGNPIPNSITLPLGVVLGPSEYRDQDGNIRDAAGNVVRDKYGRSVCKDRSPLGRGSTVNLLKGTSVPRNLREQLAVQQVLANPAAGERLLFPMNDPRWPGTGGWVKMQLIVNPGGDPINIHYVYNPKTAEVDDPKIKLPGN